MDSQYTNAYDRIVDKFSKQQCVILDGGIGTELQQQGVQEFRLSDTSHWGIEAIAYAPDAVANVHKTYVDAGCDIVTTDTYAILDVPENTGGPPNQLKQPIHWMDIARKGVCWLTTPFLQAESRNSVRSLLALVATLLPNNNWGLFDFCCVCLKTRHPTWCCSRHSR